ncbi:hypothetical protein [Albibacillus kandeliae]|uniref:hypothetical protein n=1 Tax=Albibacillus kandeliae TaxID=2174228 RepID=UPI000D68F89B|nr:hypothetical protein [Albibacillus kandeliae]
MDEKTLAVVAASPVRRVMGVSMLVMLGALSIYLALEAQPTPLWQALLIVLGVLVLWLGEKMRRATRTRVELTEEGLYDTDGTLIAKVADIEAVERGMLAFKPSNGMMIRTRTPGARAWRPGLWWRVGRRIGIGGVTPGQQGRMLADMLAAMIAEREQRGD